ncbi:uncharacterized protein [Argopecten irradians]|uniref:uncharacterized protein n=1 Tax=Argopecten irradians TaxID=31199 RepID=UPI003722A926
MASFQFTNPDKLDFSKPENWEKWFQRFERFRQASGLAEKDEAIQISTLIYSMGSEADDIFTSFSLTEANRKKWKNVVEKFNEYFIPKRNIIFERSKFNLRKQEEGETVDSFVTALHVLADHCNFGALHDEMIRDRIVVGVRDHKVSEKMQLDAKLTLEKAVIYARQSEAVRRQQAIVRGTENTSQETTENTVNRVKQKNVRPKTKNQTYAKQQHFPAKRTTGCKRCGSFKSHGRDKCPARDAKCFKCEKTGHFAKCCLTKSTLGNINSRNEDQDFLGAVNKEKSHPWITNIKIKNVDIPFKIDTGADVTVISEREHQKMYNVKLSKSTKNLHGPGNSKLCVLGKFHCEIESRDKISVEEIFVVKGLSQALLGRPAIQALGIIEKVNISIVHKKITKRDNRE